MQIYHVKYPKIPTFIFDTSLLFGIFFLPLQKDSYVGFGKAVIKNSHVSLLASRLFCLTISIFRIFFVPLQVLLK